MTYWAALEAGGTKCVCAIGTADGRILHEITIATETPAITLPKIIAFFESHRQALPLQALGIGSFAPLDLDPESPTYGFITSTPKLAWQHCNLRGILQAALGIPVHLDTDVNAAALAEHRLGAGRGVSDLVYLTVGTGIGGGAIVNNQLVHGAMHPEMGHMRIPHDRVRDPFAGVCPFHGDCWEGLASGPAILQRWQVNDARELPPDHPAWDLESDYMACAIANLLLTLSPKRVILGGGVMQQAQLLPLIQRKVQALLNGYISHPSVQQQIAQTIVLAKLGQKAGLYGALLLAVDLS